MPKSTESPRELRLLNTRQLAEVFGVSEAAVRKRIRLGQLGPAIRMGRGYVIREEALLKRIERQEAAAE